MAKQEKRLGRGLESVVSPDIGDATLATELSEDRGVSPKAPGRLGVDALMLRPEALEPNPFQPRGTLRGEDVAGLAQSLRETGMLQAIIARRARAGLQIIFGERRWRAARMAGLELVPVLVRQATDEQMLEMALVENIQRSDLNAMEKARGYRRLCDEFSLSPEEIGARVGEDRTTVTNYLRLLELPQAVMDLVSRSDISMGHARCLLGIENADRQVQLARSVVRNQLSVRALEEVVRRAKADRADVADAPARKREKSPHVADLEAQFERALGLKVTIQEGRGKGCGRIIIEYNSLDDFDRAVAALGVGRQ